MRGAADVDASVDEDQRERSGGGELTLYFLRVSGSVGRGSVVVVIVVVIVTGKKVEEEKRNVDVVGSRSSSWE